MIALQAPSQTRVAGSCRFLYDTYDKLQYSYRDPQPNRLAIGVLVHGYLATGDAYKLLTRHALQILDTRHSTGNPTALTLRTHDDLYRQLCASPTFALWA
jgi:hypothetical protein